MLEKIKELVPCGIEIKYKSKRKNKGAWEIDLRKGKDCKEPRMDRFFSKRKIVMSQERDQLPQDE